MMNPGKINGNVLKRSVLRQVKKNKINQSLLNGAGIGEDCAVFSSFGDKYTLSCMQEGEILTLSGTGFGSVSHLILKGINNLAACGGRVKNISMTLLLPEDAEEETLKTIVEQASVFAEEKGISFIGGQTRVLNSISIPIAVLNFFGVADRIYDAAAVKPGMDIVLSKYIGLEGTAYLARTEREELLLRYPAYLVNEAESFEGYYSIESEAAIAGMSDVVLMHDVSEGGIFAGIWEIAEKADVGLKIDMKRLPLRQETVEVCERLSKNPYELMSGGCLIMIANDGEALADAIRQKGITANVVGKITDDNARIFVNDEEVRYLDRPHVDALFADAE
ncbi:MAG: hydrogenase maturation factor [Acetatifactor sp.]|nr:hydrogenase maturation factor [Acetatifactor sp.]